MEYVLLLLLLFFLSFYYDVLGRSEYKLFFGGFVLSLLILLAGFRYRLGLDTPNYIDHFYHDYPLISELTWDDFLIGKDPFYVIINSVVLTLGGKFYVVQLIESAFVNFFIYRYFRKHSKFYFTCFFFYFLTCYFLFSMEIMRAAFSIVICLYAFDSFMDKKWFKGLVLYVAALLFHIQTLLVMLSPLFFFLRFNRKGFLALLFIYVSGVFLQHSLGDYFLLFDLSENTNEKLARYVRDEQGISQTGNFNFIFVHYFPLLLYSFVSFLYLKKKKKLDGMAKIEPLLMMGIAFLLLQVSCPIFTRCVDYYRIYFVLVFSEFLVLSSRNPFGNISSFIKANLVFLPLYASIIFVFYKEDGFKYYPYSSVIDRKIDINRELKYAEFNRPRMNRFEY